MEIKFRAAQFQFFVTLVMFSFLSAQNMAQVQQQQCMNQLQPCLNYMNGNNRPPDSCCRPLAYVIRSLPECLCSLMSNEGANQAEQAGINTTEAQTLPARCGQRINPLGCITGTPDRRTRNSSPDSSASFIVRSSILSTMVVASLIILSLQAILLL